MTLKEYLNKTFEHTEKTAETQDQKQRLYRDFLKRNDEFLEQGYLPDEAEDKVLETLPTPDEYREKLHLEVNKLNDTDKGFAIFRWILKYSIWLLLIIYLIGSIELSTDFFFNFGDNWALRQSGLLMFYVLWSLILNTFAILFLMNKPDSTYGEKVRKHALILIGMLTHPFGIPVLIVGLLYSYTRMQKADYFKKRLFRSFRVKKHPVAVYSGTFVAFLIITFGGFTLARGLFADEDNIPKATNIYFENIEDDRIIQSGVARLTPIEDETTEIELEITQYSFATDSPTELEHASLTYQLFNMDGLSEPIEFDKYLIMEDSLVVNQSMDSVINDFEIQIKVYYKDNADQQNVRNFLLSSEHISNIKEVEKDHSYWIWE